jgi:hypothetical protein
VGLCAEGFLLVDQNHDALCYPDSWVAHGADRDDFEVGHDLHHAYHLAEVPLVRALGSWGVAALGHVILHSLLLGAEDYRVEVQQAELQTEVVWGLGDFLGQKPPIERRLKLETRGRCVSLVSWECVRLMAIAACFVLTPLCFFFV